MSRPEATRTGANDTDPEMTAWIQQLASNEPLPDPNRPAAEPDPTPAADAAGPSAAPDRAGRGHRGTHRRGARPKAPAADDVERPDGAPTTTAGGSPAATATTDTDQPADQAGDTGSGRADAAGAADGSTDPAIAGAPAPSPPTAVLPPADGPVQRPTDAPAAPATDEIVPASDGAVHPAGDAGTGPETAPRHPDPAVPAGELPARLQALGEFVAAAEGRVDAERLAPVRALLARADERLALSDRHTVVVLAGTTGSGKSRLFNALTGLDLSRVGARRPTTANLHACIWEPAGTGPLLDWLGVPPENRTERESVLDGDAQRALHGLVLVDMPDFDSIERGHRPMVEQLVGSADMVLWVLDPQKYADRTVHESYLSSLADRDAALTVVLNQVDRLPENDVDELAADLRRLLAEDGLPAAPLHLASARTGLGVAALRAALAGAVASRQAATVRIAADLTAITDGLADLTDAEPPTGVAAGELADRLAAHIGVAGLLDAAEQDLRRRGQRATGWLFVRRALGGRNPDRILAQERYDLDWLDDTTTVASTAGTAATIGTADPAHAESGTADAGATSTGAIRTAVADAGAAGPGAPDAGGSAGGPPAGGTRIGDAGGPAAEQGTGRADAAVPLGGAARPGVAVGRPGTNDDTTPPVPEGEPPRRVGLGGVLRSSLGPVLDRLPAPWADSLRGALTEQVPTLAARLAALPAQAARGTRPIWWTALGVLQWACGVAAVAGAGWLIAATVAGSLPDPGRTAWWLLGGGVLGGVLAWLVALPLVRQAARTERAALDAALRSAVAAAAHDCVQVPVETQLTAYRAAHTALAAARGRRPEAVSATLPAGPAGAPTGSRDPA